MSDGQIIAHRSLNCFHRPLSAFQMRRLLSQFSKESYNSPKNYINRYKHSRLRVTVHVASPTTTTGPLASPPLSSIDQPLRQWIIENGGRVDPRIAVVDTAPCGARGVVALQDIDASPFPTTLDSEDSEARLLSSSLLVVPSALYLTSDDALGFLEETAKARLTPQEIVQRGRPMEPLPVQRLALLLAHERAAGSDSFFEPYITSLPREIPCAWANEGEWAAVAASLVQRFPGGMEEAKVLEVLARARTAIEQECDVLFKAWGDVLGLSSPDDISWGLGQVLSRSFGGGEACAMAPYIDLCNHKVDALRPAGAWSEDLDDACYCVFPSANGVPRGLKQGEELYITYNASAAGARLQGLTARQRIDRCLKNFLSFGFVLPEDLV